MRNPETARPGSIGESRGRKIYSIAAVMGYRKALAVTQAEVANRIRASQSFVSMVERSRDEVVQERTVRQILDAIDGVVADRARLAADGLAELDVLMLATAKAER